MTPQIRDILIGVAFAIGWACYVIALGLAFVAEFGFGRG